MSLTSGGAGAAATAQIGSAVAATTSNSSSASVASGAQPKRRGYTDPEYVVINEMLSTMGDVDELQSGGNGNGNSNGNGNGHIGHSAKRARISTSTSGMDIAARDLEQLRRPALGVDLAGIEDMGDFGDESEDDDDSDDSGEGGGGRRGSSTNAVSRHTKLTDLEKHVRDLERENLHLKQTLLLGKQGSVMIPGSGRGPRGNVQQLLSDRTRVVQEMVDQLNAPVLSLADAARVWHEDCRIGVGVREWDAFGRIETISLWNMIRCVFSSMAVDIVELRPHLPDGEMILTKWRLQGEIASPAQLQKVIQSEDCPAMMRVMLQAIKSSDLTFTVTTYVIFHDALIAEQHHCWDQVGVFKRLFGGEIPPPVQEILVIPEDEQFGDGDDGEDDADGTGGDSEEDDQDGDDGTE